MMRVVGGGGTRIAVERSGEGLAVVIVDGALASRRSHPSVPGLEDLLARTSTVLRYDRRGRGDSDHGVPGVRAEVDDLAAVLDSAGDRATVCGFSSGAVLALEAARAGLPIGSLVLYEPAVVVSDDRAAVPADYPDRLRDLVDNGDLIGALALFMTVPAGVPEQVVAGMCREWGFEQAAREAASLPYDAAFMTPLSTGDPGVLRRYRDVRTPALVLHGSETECWLKRTVQAVADVLPHARRDVVDGQGHDPSAAAIAPILVEMGAGEARAPVHGRAVAADSADATCR